MGAGRRARARNAPRLVALLEAVEHDDARRLRDLLADGLGELPQFDAPHRCLGLVRDAVRRHDLGIADVAKLPDAYPGGPRAAGRLKRAAGAVVAELRELCIPFALLGGAASAYAGERDAELCSPTVDTLVRPRDLGRARTYLRERGETREDVAVYVHDQLAPPGALSMRTDWDALAARFVGVDGHAGAALRLDALGTALYLAIVALGLTRLRDVVALSRTLRALRPVYAERLRAIVRAERGDGVRLEAALVLAARIAGLPWPATAMAERYVSWALAREDMPPGIRRHCQAAEALFAFPTAPWRTLGALRPARSDADPQRAAPSVLRRCAAGAAALFYALVLGRRFFE